MEVKDKGPFRSEGLKGVRYFKKGSAYEFLRNEYEYPFEYEVGGKKYTFRNVTAAFLARKAPGRAEELSQLSAEDAKALSTKFKKGKTTNEIDPDFEDNKVEIMEDVLRAKFSVPFLRDKLAGVPGRTIVNGNFALERFWGVALSNPPGGKSDNAGRGKNFLGILLTKLRNEIFEERGIKNPYDNYAPFVYKVQHGGYVTFDTETTGTGQAEDILQITIVGQYGELLLSTYVKSDSCVFWDGAEQVTHITPDFIEEHGAKHSLVAKAVREIFDAADTIVGHNVSFDKRMVSACFGEKPWKEYSFEDRQTKVLQRIKSKFKSGEYSDLYRRYFEDASREISDFVRDLQAKFAAGVSEREVLSQFSLGGDENSVEKSAEEVLYGKLKAFFKSDKKLDKNLAGDDGKIESVTFKKCILDLDEEDIQNLGAVFLPDITTLDTLDYFRKYGGLEKNSEGKIPCTLSDLIAHFYPLKYGDFADGAHSAEVDTRYTALLSDYIAESGKGSVSDSAYKTLARSPLSFTTPPTFSVANLFGLGNGIVVNFVNAKESECSNFSKRMFGFHPEVRKTYLNALNKMAPEKLAGKVALSTLSKSGAKVANLFAGEGCSFINDPKFTDALSKLCAFAGGECVYIPVVSSKTDGKAEIKDGCAYAKGAPKKEYEAVLKGFLDCMSNLRLVDTQTGEIIGKDLKFWGEKMQDDVGETLESSGIDIWSITPDL